jgi:signal transduction histidine kinase
LDLVHPGDRQQVTDLASDVLKSAHSTFTTQCRIQDHHDSWKPIELIATNLLDEPSVRAIAVNCRDLTERMQAEEDLKRLARRVIEVQESESKRVAGELHDSIAQMLHSAKILVDSSQDNLTHSRRSVKPGLKEASRILGKTIREVRRMLGNLRPVTLDKLGLYPAVRAVSEEFRTRTGIDLELDQKGLPEHIPADVTLALFRIIQESLANVEKHSKADRASIHFEVEGRIFRVSVKDNGKGFNRARFPVNTREAHLGLIGMIERASYIGGELIILSNRHRGTEIIVEIPIERLREVEAK